MTVSQWYNDHGKVLVNHFDRNHLQMKLIKKRESGIFQPKIRPYIFSVSMPAGSFNELFTSCRAAHMAYVKKQHIMLLRDFQMPKSSDK